MLALNKLDPTIAIQQSYYLPSRTWVSLSLLDVTLMRRAGDYSNVHKLLVPDNGAILEGDWM